MVTESNDRADAVKEREKKEWVAVLHDGEKVYVTLSPTSYGWWTSAANGFALSDSDVGRGHTEALAMGKWSALHLKTYDRVVVEMAPADEPLRDDLLNRTALHQADGRAVARDKLRQVEAALAEHEYRMMMLERTVVEIVDPRGEVSYRRRITDTLVEEAIETEGYTLRIVDDHDNISTLRALIMGKYDKPRDDATASLGLADPSVVVQRDRNHTMFRWSAGAKPPASLDVPPPLAAKADMLAEDWIELP